MHPTKKRRTAAPPRVIVSLDLDCFYASVAIRARPHLKDQPVGIYQRNLVVTTNYPARRAGVQKMGWLKDAKRVCPEIHLIDGSDLTPFRAASAEVLSEVRTWLAKRCSKHENGKSILIPCEKLGLDEVFIDITDLVQLEKVNNEVWSFAGHVEGTEKDSSIERSLIVASQLVQTLRSDVTESTNLTMSAGIGSNKVLSKLAGNMHKPNDQTVLLNDTVLFYISGLPPRKLMGIGHSTWGKLKEWSDKYHIDISTVKMLRAYFEETGRLKNLTEILGSATLAERILRLCRGEDDSPVRNSGPPKMMSCATSFVSCTTMDEVMKKLNDLSMSLLRRLHEDFMEWGFRQPKTLSVKFRFKSQGHRCVARSAPLPFNTISPSVCSGDEQAVEQARGALLIAAGGLVQAQGDIGTGKVFDLSLLGLGVSNFSAIAGNIAESSLGRFLGPVKSIKKDIVASAADTESEEGPSHAILRCPICHCKLPLAPTLQTAHVDSCIKSSGTADVREGDDKKSKSCLSESQSEECVERPLCPICQCALPLSSFFQNAHIDACIAPKPSSKSRLPAPHPNRKRRIGGKPIESYFMTRSKKSKDDG